MLLNDTVGTLACARYGDGMHQTDTAMSLIVGTGACALWLDAGLVPVDQWKHAAAGSVQPTSERA